MKQSMNIQTLVGENIPNNYNFSQPLRGAFFLATIFLLLPLEVQKYIQLFQSLHFTGFQLSQGVT